MTIRYQILEQKREKGKREKHIFSLHSPYNTLAHHRLIEILVYRNLLFLPGLVAWYHRVLGAVNRIFRNLTVGTLFVKM